MRLQPRQHILDIWQATARTSYQNRKWRWGGRDLSNSISDAEQLLCLMTPATEVPSFKLDLPDQTADDVLESLEELGDSVEIPKVLVRLLTDYMTRYTDESGTPVFAGESYFRGGEDEPATDAQRALEVVDSFSMSVTLSLATIGFLRVFRGIVTRQELRQDVDTLEEMASKRLSAAMIGLLRSFVVSVFEAGSSEGKALVRTANQSGSPERQVVDELRTSLRDINARLRDVTIGSGSGQASDLDNPNRLFECGWSWGIVKNAPTIKTSEDVGEQRDGVALPAPYLYFTVVALDGIAALFSERTRLLGLLNEEQTRLAQALQLRWDLTQSYWSTIASFGSGRWPLEDIPWRTTDDVESDYFTLLVSSIMAQDLVRRRAADVDVDRVGRVLHELANRSRITRRPFKRDPALAVHAPGVPIELHGSEERGGARLIWMVSDFSPTLLKRTIAVAGLLTNTELRGGLLELADEVWSHLLVRRINGELWDQPANAFPQVTVHHELPSWYYTKRVTDCLVTAANVVSGPPLRSTTLTDLATDLLSEADHLFDHELLRGAASAGPAMRMALRSAEAKLRRARRIIGDRPGSAFVLASEVLQELDGFAAARQDLTGAP
jgi:hypothetical protein